MNCCNFSTSLHRFFAILPTFRNPNSTADFSGLFSDIQTRSYNIYSMPVNYKPGLENSPKSSVDQQKTAANTRRSKEYRRRH